MTVCVLSYEGRDDGVLFASCHFEERCAMGWPRSLLYYPCAQSYAKSEHDDNSERDDGSWQPETPSSSSFQGHSPTPAHAATPRKLPFQPSYVYDADAELRALQVDRDARRLRNCVCCGISVFGTIFVLVCFGMVLAGSPTPQAQAMHLINRIEESSMVQFTITPKPHTVFEKYGKLRETTTDFYGLRMVRGQLFPYRSSAAANRLSLDGWIHVQTNTSVRYDMMLSNHRGYRVMRSGPLPRQGRSRCVTFDDVPPLHYLPSAAAQAFEAQDWASFRMNCSRATQAPVEIVFARMPFVFCPGDLESRPFSPIPNGTTPLSHTQVLWIHGERMLVEVVLVNNKLEAAHARSERTSLESFEMWGNATSVAIENCPYLEAPLVAYTPPSFQLLDTLLGKKMAPRQYVGSESKASLPQTRTEYW